MKRMVCIPIHCRCGQRAVWAADVDWLAREGLDATASIHSPLGLSLPRDAEDVTGKFNIRCRQCFEILSVFALIRARLAAGGGVIVELPARERGPVPVLPGDPLARGMDKGMRLTGRDGRRARRITIEAEMPARASVVFDLKVADISALGLAAEHSHEIQVGNLYTLSVRVPSQPEALRINARAVWTTSHRIEQKRGARQKTYRSGFEFVGLEPQVASTIDAYVSGRTGQGSVRRG